MITFQFVLKDIKEQHNSIHITIENYRYGINQDLKSEIPAALVISKYFKIIKFESWAAKYWEVIKSLEKFDNDTLTETQKLIKTHETLINATSDAISAHLRSESKSDSFISFSQYINLGKSKACEVLLPIAQDIFKQLMDGE